MRLRYIVLATALAAGCHDVVQNGDAWDVSDPRDAASNDGGDDPRDVGYPDTVFDDGSRDAEATDTDRPSDASADTNAPSPDADLRDASDMKRCSVSPAMGREPLEFFCPRDQMCFVDEVGNPSCLDTTCTDSPRDQWCTCVLDEFDDLCSERCTEDGNGARCDFFL
jgi:hypothetical protein